MSQTLRYDGRQNKKHVFIHAWATGHQVLEFESRKSARQWAEDNNIIYSDDNPEVYTVAIGDTYLHTYGSSKGDIEFGPLKGCFLFRWNEAQRRLNVIQQFFPQAFIYESRR